MSTVTQEAIEQGYEKMKKLPQNQLVLLLGIIDQFSSVPPPAAHVTLGLADGKYHVPDDINQYDDQIAQLFGIQT